MASKQAQVAGRPIPGFYLLRRVPKGWAVPCQVVETNGLYSYILDGSTSGSTWSEEELREFWVDFLVAKSTHPLVQIQAHGQPCDRATYEHRLAMKTWAETNAPDHPCLHSTRPMVTFRLDPTEF